MQMLPAQVSRDILERNTNTNVRLAIKDAKTAEPISWASTSCRFLDGMEWIAKEDWITRDNNPDSPKERMIYIATWMNGTCSCYCVFPGNYFDTLNGKEFEPLRNYPKFGKLCERVKALIIIKPN